MMNQIQMLSHKLHFFSFSHNNKKRIACNHFRQITHPVEHNVEAMVADDGNDKMFPRSLHTLRSTTSLGGAKLP